MATIRDIVIDCERAPALARFWATVLEEYDVRPYDDAEIARLASLGLTPDTDPVVFVTDRARTCASSRFPSSRP
jgi:hypothetical protein